MTLLQRMTLKELSSWLREGQMSTHATFAYAYLNENMMTYRTEVFDWVLLAMDGSDESV